MILGVGLEWVWVGAVCACVNWYVWSKLIVEVACGSGGACRRQCVRVSTGVCVLALRVCVCMMVCAVRVHVLCRGMSA